MFGWCHNRSRVRQQRTQRKLNFRNGGFFIGARNHTGGGYCRDCFSRKKFIHGQETNGTQVVVVAAAAASVNFIWWDSLTHVAIA